MRRLHFKTGPDLAETLGSSTGQGSEACRSQVRWLAPIQKWTSLLILGAISDAQHPFRKAAIPTNATELAEADLPSWILLRGAANNVYHEDPVHSVFGLHFIDAHISTQQGNEEGERDRGAARCLTHCGFCWSSLMVVSACSSLVKASSLCCLMVASSRFIK